MLGASSNVENIFFKEFNLKMELKKIYTSLIGVREGKVRRGGGKKRRKG